MGLTISPTSATPAPYVEKVYQLDKAHAFDGAGTPESRHFTAERLAAGASMLRDLIVAAWIKSAEPVPDWRDPRAPAAAGGTGRNLLGRIATRLVAFPLTASWPTVSKLSWPLLAYE